jgi:hypothetical protein
VPTVSFQDPGFARGFSSLAEAFAPSPQNVMRAALMGAQREQAIARAGVYDANAAQTNVQTGALRSLPDVMVNVLGPEATPQQVARARAMGVVAQAPGGLQHGPGFMVGAETFANPQARSPQDLSTIMTAAGVQTYGNTPTGYQEGIQSTERVGGAQNASRERIATEGNVAWERQRQNEAAVDAQTKRAIATEGNQAYRDVEAAKLAQPGGGSTGRPRTIGSGELQRMSEVMKQRLAARFNVKPDSVEVDQEVQAALRSEAARVYQETGNAEAAVEAGLAAIATKFQSTGWFSRSGRVIRDPAYPAPPTTLPPAGAAPAQAARPAAPAPAAAAAPQGATAGEGAVIRERATGKLFVIRNGRPEPME